MREPPLPAPRRRAGRLLLALLALAPALGGGCAGEADVVVYCSLDQVHAERVLRRFEEQTGLDVRAEFDIEANKTVGLVTRLREEHARPRCDVFWNNEIAHTIALAEEGLLAPYRSPAAADIPSRWFDPEGRWTGFAARARVFIVNTDELDPAELHGMADLLDPRWKGRACMARPLTGTTLTHVTAMFTLRGDAATLDFLRGVREAGVGFVQSNGQVMSLVREGSMAWGLTDTDDYNVAREGGWPVAAVFPDQGPGGEGTLLIPNTVCILADAPHPEAARRLVDHLLSPAVEAELAASSSAQIPLRPSVARPAWIPSAEELVVLPVDYAEVGRQIARRQRQLTEMFLR